MFVPMVNFYICYLLMTIIQTITCNHPCVFEAENGKKIDIRSLGYDKGKGPKYDNIPNSSPTKSTLNWNGCFPYKKSGGGDCQDAAACQTNINTGESTLIAKPSSVKFEHHDSVNLLVYESSSKLLTVYLQCSTSDKDQVTATQEDIHTFNIYVKSRCCCPGQCIQSDSLPGGAVFLILLVCFLFVYLVGGALFLKYQRGASGVDLIPNRILWLTVISYATDGVKYFLPCLRGNSSKSDYSNI